MELRLTLPVIAVLAVCCTASPAQQPTRLFIFFRATGMIEPVRRVRARTVWSATARAITALVLACPGLSAYGQNSTASQSGNLPDTQGLAAPSDHAVQNPSSPPASIDSGVISGTVLDTNKDVIQGAHVALSDHAGAKREMESGPNGQFAFSALPSGSYRVSITGNGMGTFVSPWITLHPGEIRIISQAVLPVAAAVTNITVNANHIEINQELADRQVQIAEDQRIWGVFPNFYSSYDWNAPPMGPKQKFRLAFRSMMDPMAFAGAAGIAGFEQYYDFFPGYGRGVQGYFKRFGAAYTNDFSARMLASGMFATLFHQDPRYFYKGAGSFQSRALYAISCAYVTRDDKGRRRPNYSHVLGVFASAALSNLYYPKGSRGLRLTLVNGAMETAGNSGTDLVREFILKGITSHAGGKPLTGSNHANSISLRGVLDHRGRITP